MKAKLNALRALALRQKEKLAVASMLAMSGAAMAQTASAPTLDSILSTFLADIMTGLGTTFAKIGPLLALVFGVSYAWKWVKKGSST